MAEIEFGVQLREGIVYSGGMGGMTADSAAAFAARVGGVVVQRTIGDWTPATSGDTDGGESR